MSSNGRHVTESTGADLHHHDGYWIGRLSMALAVAEKAPQTARDALHEFVDSNKPTPELRRMLREELKRK